MNRKRFRTCTDPPPSDGGNSCVGEATDSEEQKCNIEDCLSKCQISIVVTLQSSLRSVLRWLLQKKISVISFTHKYLYQMPNSFVLLFLNYFNLIFILHLQIDFFYRPSKFVHLYMNFLMNQDVINDITVITNGFNFYQKSTNNVYNFKLLNYMYLILSI